MRHLRNIFNLGIKELRSLLGDKAMLTLIVFSFTVSVYSSATVTPGSLNLAPIAIADMDGAGGVGIITGADGERRAGCTD